MTSCLNSTRWTKDLVLLPSFFCSCHLVIDLRLCFRPILVDTMSQERLQGVFSHSTLTRTRWSHFVCRGFSWTWILMSSLRECLQIWYKHWLGLKDELIRFQLSKVKVTSWVWRRQCSRWQYFWVVLHPGCSALSFTGLIDKSPPFSPNLNIILNSDSSSGLSSTPPSSLLLPMTLWASSSFSHYPNLPP